MVRDRDVKICGIKDMKCFKEVEKQYNLDDTCSCLLACGEIIYNFDTLQLDHSREKDSSGFVYSGTIDMSSEMTFQFKSESFNPLILKRQFTELDFISYTGGALGLFLGFSVLSFIEIIYYFTIRICFEKYRLRRVGVLGHSDISGSNLIKDYLSSSSIHGMNQVAFKRRHLIERLIWITLLSLALIYGGITIINMFDAYKNAPIVMTYEDKPIHIDEVCNCTFKVMLNNNYY
jgi:Amiloride-sensitive sodium channel